jgi:adenylate cyclase
VDKFVGDMVMALFGAPLDDPDHADHAVATAIEMVKALDALNARWTQEGRPALGIGIGVNSGEMIAGNIGSASIRSYTVIGDAVNLGARLESLNKERGTTIIVSAATVALLKTPPPLRPLGSVVVKGKSVPVEIFEVVVSPGTAETAPAGR